VGKSDLRLNYSHLAGFLEFSKHFEKIASFLVFLRGRLKGVGCVGGYWVKPSVQA
jgi:hypothetical protein